MCIPMNSSLTELKEEIAKSLFYLAVDMHSVHSTQSMRDLLYVIRDKSRIYIDQYYNLINEEDKKE